MARIFTRDTLNRHLKEDHKLNTVSDYFQEIVYGGIDGIVTTFAVVAGFSGANAIDSAALPTVTVLLFGLANVFADASSMGLGNLLSVRSAHKARQRHVAIEQNELHDDQRYEVDETIYLLKEKGYSEADAKAIANLMAKNEAYWLEFMMMYELDMPSDGDQNPFLTSLATFLSFIMFGTIPLAPYLLIPTNSDTFIISVFSTIIALVLLGTLRWRITRERLWVSLLEVAVIGGISSTIAYTIGTLFAL